MLENEIVTHLTKVGIKFGAGGNRIFIQETAPSALLEGIDFLERQGYFLEKGVSVFCKCNGDFPGSVTYYATMKKIGEWKGGKGGCGLIGVGD